MLISAGLVETRAGRGTFVAIDPGSHARRSDHGYPLERQEVEELVEARELIEVQIAGLAAGRATPAHVVRLRACIEQMEHASASPYDYPDADAGFHLALSEAAGNRYLLRAMSDLRSFLERDMELAAEAAIRRFGDLRVSVDSHRRLVDAIEGGDVERARALATEIVHRNREFVLGLYALAPSPVRAAG